MTQSFSKSDLKTFLRDRGLSIVAAEIWAEFARQVIAIYWQATDRLLQPANWDAFKKKSGALGAPTKGQRNQGYRAPIEDAITSEIGHFADECFMNLDADHFLRRHSVQLAYEALIYNDKRAGRHSKKADFRARSAFPGAPSLAIEAKPLRNKSDVQNRYFAEDGMGCFFTDDSPYEKGPLGAMFAYTITNTSTSMRELIRDGIETYKPIALTVAAVDEGNGINIDCSHHDRSTWNLVPITILHLERMFPVDIPSQKDTPPSRPRRRRTQ